jgi:hypothetical protein
MATMDAMGGVYLSRAGWWYDGGDCFSLLALITAERDGYYGLKPGLLFVEQGGIYCGFSSTVQTSRWFAPR